ncbi:esterase/lipase family protein [Aliivibrio kagoshimensis]|uniref:esterase/lipase family protein n=1 Tax=Aliivibrio kagoshimensis TaxID=2910230 RepID=UPI003D121ABD
MNRVDLFRCSSIGVLLTVIGCSSPVLNETDTLVIENSSTTQSLQIDGLKHCNNENDATINVNPDEPLTVIVHGCFSSAGRFRTLADVYSLHDQQAICFEYNDRDSLEKASGELVSALNQLSQQNPQQSLHVIGHSQGGLISRRALTAEREDQKAVNTEQLQLTTVSAPFNGINASSHCGITSLRILSLGIVDLICYAVTGEKYQQIPPNVEFIQQPGSLLSSVSQHVVIKTDERNQCRHVDESGECVEDDYVFSVSEQTNQNVDGAGQVSTVTVAAGHVEIVGNGQSVPTDLITILKEKNLLVDKKGVDDLQQARRIKALYLPQR